MFFSEYSGATPEYSGVLRSTPEYSGVLRSCSGVLRKKHALLRSTPEYSGVAPEYSEVLLRSTPEYSGVAPEYSGVAPELLRRGSGVMMQHCLCVILMVESLEGKEEEVPLPQSSFYSSSSYTERWMLKKTHFSGYVHTLKVND